MRITLRATLLLPLVSGCVATALYGSPRPAAPGTVKTVLFLEQNVDGGAVLAPSKSSTSQALESQLPGAGIELRFGLAPGIDLGTRLSMASLFIVDSKVALLDRKYVTVSLDPAIQLAPYLYASTSQFTGQASMRLLAGWRPAPGLELIGHGTVGALGDTADPRGFDAVGTWGGGISILMHPSDWTVGFQPSITVLWRSDRAAWHPEAAFGFGLVLGGEP